jgi:hypothetical protein
LLIVILLYTTALVDQIDLTSQIEVEREQTVQAPMVTAART